MVLLLLGDRLDFVWVEEVLLATPNPVLVAGVDVKDLSIDGVSGLSDDLGIGSCTTRMSEFLSLRIATV